MKVESPFPPGSHVAAYLRDSGGPGQDASIDRQKAEIAAWAEANQVYVTRWFVDAARSGGSTAGRDRFREMAAYFDVKGRPEKGLVFWEYARLARAFDDAMFYMAAIRVNGYIVYSITDAIPDTLEGRLLESIVAWKNAKYREDLSRAVKSGYRRVVAFHKGYPNRMAPLGYKKELMSIGTRRDGTERTTNRLVPDPEIAPKIVKAFELRAGGASYAEIHNELALLTWNVSYNRLLHDPIYIGNLVWAGETFAGFCEPLVSQELWLAVQAVNKKRAAKHGYDHPRRLRSRFILTGLIKCAHCGSLMNARTITKAKQKRFDYYRCRNTSTGKASTCKAPMIPKEEVEQLVIKTLEEVVLRPEIMLAAIEEYRLASSSRLRAHAEHIVQLQRDAENAKRRVSNIVNAIGAAGHSQALIDDLAKAERELAEHLVELNQASAADLDEDAIPEPEMIPAIIQSLVTQLHGKPITAAKVLRTIVTEIRVKRVGGSPTRNRGGKTIGNIDYKLPMLTNSLGNAELKDL